MKKINIYSTELKNGFGGISTALVGYIQAFNNRKIAYECITTHSHKHKIKYFINSLRIAYHTEKNDICWMHVGPWLSMLRKIFIATICKLRHGQVIFHLHSPKTFDYTNNFFGSLLLKTIFKLSDKIIVLTPWWKDLLIKFDSRIEKKLIILPNPLDEQLMQIARKKIDRVGPPRKILSMSRLEKGKGVDLVIKAMPFLNNSYELIIAGTGSYENELKQLVNKYNLNERVTFVGWINYDKKCELLSTSDIFCLPSTLDSFGMVYLEAMAADLPVIAFNYQAIPDVIPSNLGSLVDINISSEQLAYEISKINRIDEYQSSNYVISTFNNEVICDRFLSSVING